MSPGLQRFLAAARKLPDTFVLSDREDLYAYRYDASVDRQWPSAVVLPETQDALIEAGRLAHEAGLPVTCRGAGTGLSGGAVPDEGAVVLVSTRLRKVHEICQAQRWARVEPGVVNQSLSRSVGHTGLHYAPDPSSGRTCTIGGNIAENSGGPHCLKYGVTGSHLLDLRVLLTDGEVVSLGGLVRDPPGYDLLSFVCGSEGTLALSLEAVVALTPVPEGLRTFLATFSNVEDACRAVARIIDQGLIPAALELIDRLTMDAVEEVIKAGYPKDAAAVLLIEIDGLEASLDDQAARVRTACDGLVLALEEAKSEEERALLWRGRKESIGALGRKAKDYYIQDGVIPRSRLPEVLSEIAAIGERHKVRIANVFHAGDGNLHPVILFDRSQDGELERVIQAGTEILARCIAVGGAITGEHGVGLEKRHALPLLFTEAEIALQKALRAVFDPRGVMNPSKIFPQPKTCQEGGHRTLEEGPADSREQQSVGTRREPKSDLERGLVSTLKGSTPVEITGHDSWDPDRPRSALVPLQADTGIVAFPPEDLVVTVRAGTKISELQAALAEHGQRVALTDPFGGTVGGLLAARPGGGHRRSLHGSERESILGLRFLTADGQIHQFGGQVPKNVSGYDLCRLLLGSRGSLALILEASLRTNPRVEGSSLVLAASVEVCCALADALAETRLPFAGLSVVTGAESLLETSEPTVLVVGLEDQASARERVLKTVREMAETKGASVLNEVSGEEHEGLWGSLDRAAKNLSGSHPVWQRCHDSAGVLSGLEALPENSVVIASRLTGLRDEFTQSPVSSPLPKGAWRRQLRPYDPKVEMAFVEPRVLQLMGGVKEAFDPQGRFSNIVPESAS